MTKSEAARRLSEILECSSPEAEKLVQTVFDVLTEGLVKEGGVRIPSFGTFSLFTRKPRHIKDVQTGEVLHIHSRPQVSFSAAARLKDLIRRAS